MKKIQLLLVLLVAGFACTSCSSDDDSVSPREGIVGIWDAKSYHFVRYRDSEKVNEVHTVYDENNVVEMRFLDDGTFIHHYRENGTVTGSYTGTYTVDRDEIIMVYVYDNGAQEIVRAGFAMSRKELTTVVDDVDYYGGSMYREVTTIEYVKM